MGFRVPEPINPLNMTQLVREKIFEGFHKQSRNGIYYSVQKLVKLSKLLKYLRKESQFKLN